MPRKTRTRLSPLERRQLAQEAEKLAMLRLKRKQELRKHRKRRNRDGFDRLSGLMAAATGNLSP
ncbi:hypothetical protein [Parvularcula maris]|uniref:Uncharacterized protein n=1 Tax=Parvularcula maris TaxID=2965077 RepID=A0A9X2LA57_9PROT|nr:hypothetical protein [Parvularcula maris]MCQ8184837.1 hypothetical protein [Parvularcula maris]